MRLCAFMFHVDSRLEATDPIHTLSKAVHLTLQQAHEEAGQCHGEDWLGAEVGQDGGEGRHRPPGRRRQQEDLLASHPVDTEWRRSELAFILGGKVAQE